MNETTRIPAFVCWGCGKLNDATTAVEDDTAPEEGAWCVCLYCNHVARFDKDLTVRQLTMSEWDEVFQDDNLLKVMRANAVMMRLRK